MSAKELSVSCPCCESRLVIDVRTAKVVTWSRAGEVDATGRPKVTDDDWDAAHKRATGRLSEGTSKFDENLSREQKRAKDLDDLWNKLGGEETETES